MTSISAPPTVRRCGLSPSPGVRPARCSHCSAPCQFPPLSSPARGAPLCRACSTCPSSALCPHRQASRPACHAAWPRSLPPAVLSLLAPSAARRQPRTTHYNPSRHLHQSRSCAAHPTPRHAVLRRLDSRPFTMPPSPSSLAGTGGMAGSAGDRPPLTSGSHLMRGRWRRCWCWPSRSAPCRRPCRANRCGWCRRASGRAATDRDHCLTHAAHRDGHSAPYHRGHGHATAYTGGYSYPTARCSTSAATRRSSPTGSAPDPALRSPASSPAHGHPAPPADSDAGSPSRPLPPDPLQRRRQSPGRHPQPCRPIQCRPPNPPRNLGPRQPRRPNRTPPRRPNRTPPRRPGLSQRQHRVHSRPRRRPHPLRHPPRRQRPRRPHSLSRPLHPTISPQLPPCRHPPRHPPMMAIHWTNHRNLSKDAGLPCQRDARSPDQRDWHATSSQPITSEV